MDFQKIVLYEALQRELKERQRQTEALWKKALNVYLERLRIRRGQRKKSAKLHLRGDLTKTKIPML